MRDGPVSLWGTYCDGVGTPIRLVFRRIQKGGSPRLEAQIAERADPCFHETLDAAFVHVASTIGWPAAATFEVSLESVAATYPLPDDLQGDSLFGAFAIGLAQSAVRLEPPSLKHYPRYGATPLRSVVLRRVGVTAAFSPKTGQFAPVGCIRDKLDGFCQLDIQEDIRPSVCVVAAGQNLNDVRGRCQPSRHVGELRQENEFSYRAPYLEGRREIPLIRVYNTIDAFLKLWELQVADLIRYFR